MKNKIIMGLTTTALLASLLTAPIFAGEKENVPVTVEKGYSIVSFTLETELFIDLVENKIISQEKAEDMQTFLKQWNEKVNKETEKFKNDEQGNATVTSSRTFDMYSDMVEEGILTQKEADAINAFYKEKARKSWEASLKEALDRYVSEEIIDKTTAEKASRYLNKAWYEGERGFKGGLGVSIAMSAVDPDAVEIVAAADVIENVVFEVNDMKPLIKVNGEVSADEDSVYSITTCGSGFSMEMAPLVEEGIITQSQLDKMLESDSNTTGDTLGETFTLYNNAITIQANQK